MPLVDYKNHKEGMPYELKFPFRSTNNNKWPRTSSSPQTRAAGTVGTLIKAPPSDVNDRNSAVIPRSVSSDGRPINPKRFETEDADVQACSTPVFLSNHVPTCPYRYSPGNDNYAVACSIVMGRTLHNTNSPSSIPYNESMSSAHWRQKSAHDGYWFVFWTPMITNKIK